MTFFFSFTIAIIIIIIAIAIAIVLAARRACLATVAVCTQRHASVSGRRRRSPLLDGAVVGAPRRRSGAAHSHDRRSGRRRARRWAGTGSTTATRPTALGSRPGRRRSNSNSSSSSRLPCVH